MSALLDGVDWEVVAVFAALVLIEGLRRIPAGGLVVRTIGWSEWRPAGQVEARARWGLVSWWPPIAPALVLPPLEGTVAVSAGELARRVQVARRWAPWLAIGGALTTAGLVLGIPVATARLGGFGLIASAVVVLALAGVTAACGWGALRRLGSASATPRRRALKWCSPFSSGRALEGVYEAALAGASPAQAVRALAGEAAFAEWVRTRAYDAVHGGRIDSDLAAAASDATLSAIVASAPPRAGDGNAYCPRCAAVWIVARESCPDCEVPAVSSG